MGGIGFLMKRKLNLNKLQNWQKHKIKSKRIDDGLARGFFSTQDTYAI